VAISRRLNDLSAADEMGSGRGLGFGSGVGRGDGLRGEAFAEEERRVNRIALSDMAASERCSLASTANSSVKSFLFNVLLLQGCQ
jgi:hypothetical protein